MQLGLVKCFVLQIGLDCGLYIAHGVSTIENSDLLNESNRVCVTAMENVPYPFLIACYYTPYDFHSNTAMSDECLHAMGAIECLGAQKLHFAAVVM